MSQRPEATEYHPQHAGYVALVPDGDVLECLRAQPTEVRRVLTGVAPGGETYRYAEGKWSIRDVLGHVCDTERVFGYRALCVARGDATPLPGFEEQAYGATAGADAVPLEQLVEEFARARASNLDMLGRLPQEAWHARGTANGSALSVRGQAFVMAGHVLHHLGVLRERYGVA